ncbi:hypothetical protein Pfo_016276 [Paulownia fortunei]|nr:hypothetical protein Pfo_016276 [Paulownia fortunei]
MKTGHCGCAGRRSDIDSSSVMPNDQNYENKCLHNISVRTGEEFSPEFLRDHVTSRRMPFANDADQIPMSEPGFDAVKNQHLEYKDLTGLPGITRRDSESCTEFSDFCPRKGYGFDVDYKTYLDGSSTYYRAFQASAQYQRKFSDFDRVSPSGPSVHSLDSPNSYEPYNKGSGILDSSFSGKMKFLCSFGGKILPRPNDGKLRYVGGETRIVSIKKNLTYLELVKKTTAICNYLHTIKYQLPGEDLDALISVSSDEDLHHMIEEYHDLERRSQRLRLFLVSSGDLEGPSSSEARTIQKIDADYQYVVTVNGMVDPCPHRSSSRESLESQWASNLDGSPTLQKDSPTSFHHLENQNGDSSLNLKLMLSSPSSQVVNAPQVPSKSYIPSPPLSPVQFKDPKTSYMKGYENVTCSYGYNSNGSYVMETPAYDNPCCADASGYYHNHPIDTVPVIGSPNQNSHMVQSHATPMVGSHFRKPSKEFQSPSPYGPSYSDARRGFLDAAPLHSEKLVPSQDTFSFFLVSDVHAKSYRRVTNLRPESQPTNEGRPSVFLEQGSEKTYLTFAAEKSLSLAISSSSQGVVEQQRAHEKYHIPRNKDQLFQEPPNLNKDHIEWGKDTIKWMKNKEISFDQDRKNYATNNDYASNANFLEHKHDLPQIICHRDSKLSIHVPTSEPQVNGGKSSSSSSNSAENPTEVWKELPGNYQISPNEPEFLIRSQKANSELKHHIPNAIDCNTAFLGCHGLQPVAAQESNSQSQFITPVLFPADDSSLCLCLSDPLIFPETNINDALSGEASGQKEMVNASYERMVKDSHGSVKKEKPDRNSHKELNIKNGTFVNSQSSDNCHETCISETPVIVEDVTDSLPPTVPSSSTTIPRILDEHSDGIESPGEETEAESLIYESDDDDVEVDEDNKDESLGDAAIIEMEASIYGLQIISNADLEDLQELGSGTFGTVYHGKWRGTDVAIKRIKKSCFAGRSSEQERLTKDFWREAKILSRLHHPNVVAFYGVVPDGPGGTLATVAEYMANGSLRHVLLRKDRALDRRKKVIIALDASFGMEYLHLKNIVHFDLKCDNLLVNLGDSQRPVCKVGDFGLSRIKQNTLVSGGVRGTLPWMAPELLNGSSSRVSEKVDVFSFGIVMWEILTGEEPYLNMHCGAIIGGIVNNTLRPPIPERCDPEWRKLMEECWSHDPAARPSFTEITNRLRVMSTALQPKRFNRVKR